LAKGDSSFSKINGLVNDRDLLFDGKADNIWSSTKLRTHDVISVKADEPRNEKMIDFAFQLNGMGNQKFHWKATVFEINDLLLLSDPIRHHHLPTQCLKESLPERKVTIKHQGSGNA
jgi:hypothetical protein